MKVNSTIDDDRHNATEALCGIAGELRSCLSGPSDDVLAALESLVASVGDNDQHWLAGRALARRINGLEMDAEACLAGFLYGLRHAAVDVTAVAEALQRPGVAELVRAVVRMDGISQVAQNNDTGPDRSENLRRMLIGMIDDVRVVVVRLAAQLEYLNELKTIDSVDRFEVARETLDLFAPLANRLGIWQLKWELEDMAFRFLEPERYHALAAKLDERRSDREQFIDEFVETIRSQLAAAGIDGDVKGRPKHLYSIWRKMQSKSVDIDHVFDVRAVRILVDSTQQCYAVLGLVHERWSPVAGEFDDYIATPKSNGYQSIHTAVVGPLGRIVEVQVRTHAMHIENELGIAAHWRYKEGVSGDQSVNSKVLWLRSLLDWKDEVASTSEFVERLEHEVVQERLYVFAPDGRVVDLPEGATPVDFAYAIHTEVGHSCRGARVNGRIVPLHHKLKTGEQVEILRGRRGGPSRDWVQSGQFVHTSRARARIQRFLKQQHYDENVAGGRTLLERELTRLGMKHVPYDSLAEKHKFRKVEDFLAAIGCGDVRVSQAVSSLKNELTRQLREAKTQRPVGLPRKKRRGKPGGLEVQGVGNLVTTMASCCSPVPGDAIGGYISATRGVTVHRQDCDNYLRLRDSEPARLLMVGWGEDTDRTLPVDIQLFGYDRPGLLAEVSSVLADADVNVLTVDSRTNTGDNTVAMVLTIEVGDVQYLSRVLSQLLRIPNITDAHRVAH